MSLARNSDLASSTSESARLFLLSPVTLRPMTSHARIEGGALYTKGEREVADLRPVPRKSFLPQLATKCANGLATLTEENSDSDTYRQKMWAGQANILVTVRLRPLLSHDRDRVEIVKVLGNKEVVVLTRSAESRPIANSQDRRHSIHSHQKPRHASASPAIANGTRRQEKHYAFDYVFTPNDGQQKVYQHTTKFLIHGVLNGFNATVFAYGCTGAGKTYTMLGTPEEPGIMAKTLDDLFRNIERVHADPAGRVQYRVTVSFLEVYNENIRDLLSASSSCSSAPSMPTSEFLDLREDPIRGSVVAGLSEVEANDAQDVMKLLRRGNKYRSQESTAANSFSSRSHAVLQVHIEQQEKLNPGDCTADSDYDETDNIEVKFGKLSLVDLAGSERAAVTQNRGQRLLEGANINRSLLALGNCINALGEKGGTFVPYRDSKLTRLLKDSLGGNCRTVMIANVSLAASSLEETLNTLKYANRAKNIKTTVRRNVVEAEQTTLNQNSLVTNLQEEIATLKKELLRQQEKAETSRHSPPESERRWVERKKSSADNNSDDEDWMTTKLREARLYITECFQERRRLRHALLKLEHQGQVSRSLRHPLEICDCSSSTTVEAAKKDTEDQQLAALSLDREGLMQQLARNERAMDEFHRGIEQSPLMERNALIREVLLMEYRIGNLEIDKMQLQTLRDLQMNNGVGEHGNNEDLSMEYLDASFVPNVGRELHLDLPALASDRSQPQTSDRDSDRYVCRKLSQAKGSWRSFENIFIRVNQMSSCQAPGSGAHGCCISCDEQQHWGLHLNNASLPYIRLKKKNPIPLYVQPTTSGSLQKY
ncbi:Kinesin-like protein [Phytophthora cactorum]|nr:Kinesin-like protein [Phytophthora cactorum]